MRAHVGGRCHDGCVTDFEAWRASKEHADASAAAAAAASDAHATVTDLGPGFWMVTVSGATRGFITQIVVKDEVRFEARMRHMNPGQGTRIGEYWELEKAIAAILQEPPQFLGRDPFRELTNYVSREQMLERTERKRLQRRANRYFG
jgi:hypothetical protein